MKKALNGIFNLIKIIDYTLYLLKQIYKLTVAKSLI